MKNETTTEPNYAAQAAEILARIKTIENREILHPAGFTTGPRIGRVVTVLDTLTGKTATSNFWYDSNGKLLYVR